MPVETNVADHYIASTFQRRNIDGEIYAAQIHAVYQHMPMILADHVANSALVALVLASYMGQNRWWIFFAAVISLNGVRALDWSWYRHHRKPATITSAISAAVGSGLCEFRSASFQSRLRQRRPDQP